jgi:hypothetical protein
VLSWIQASAGKKDEVPEHRVYEFCRRHARIAYAVKGFDHRDQPLSVKRIDVTPKGKAVRYGLDLVRLDSDFFKSWVHQRVRWPDDQPGRARVCSHNRSGPRRFVAFATTSRAFATTSRAARLCQRHCRHTDRR